MSLGAGASGRVVLLKGQSQYDALRIFIDELAVAFRARGYTTFVLDMVQSGESLAAMERDIFSAPIDLVFSFCIMGEFRDPQGRSIAQMFAAPHVIQHVDYPLTHATRLDGTPSSTALLVIDETHVEAIQSVYGAERFAHVGFSPHGAIGAAAPLPGDAVAYAEARPIPILFTGSFYRPGPPPWADFGDRARLIFDNAVDIALSAGWTPALVALDLSLRAEGFDPTDPELSPMRRLASFVHEQVRMQRRLEVFTAAAEVGLPLHVYGKGYDTQLDAFRNVTHGGDVDLNQAIALMRQSRIVLNINANFGAGSHERPLTALLAGAVPASDHSRFYETRLKPGEDIILYRWLSLRDDLAKLATLSADPDTLLAMAHAGQARVATEHRWIHRVDAIVSAAAAARSQLNAAA